MGPSGSQINQQNQLLQSEIGIGQQQVDLSKSSAAKSDQNYQQMQALLKPAINYNTALASGDKSTVLSALGPQITQLTKARAANKGQIMEQVGPGAARDVALAQNIEGTNDQIAALTNQAPQTALDKLANIGSGLGSFSLNETGAALSGLAGGSQSVGAGAQIGQGLMSIQAQNKASTLGFLGELAGAGGTLAASAFSKPAQVTLSDVRLKENIEKVAEVEGVGIYTYNLKGDSTPQIGVMAQEVHEVFPDAVIVGDETKPWMVNYPSVLAKMALMAA